MLALLGLLLSGGMLGLELAAGLHVLVVGDLQDDLGQRRLLTVGAYVLLGLGLLGVVHWALALARWL